MIFPGFVVAVGFYFNSHCLGENSLIVFNTLTFKFLLNYNADVYSV